MLEFATAEPLPVQAIAQVARSKAMTVTVAELMEQCAGHNSDYARHRSALDANNTSACFELFRLALAEGNDGAWHAIENAYRGQVTAWVRSHAHFARSGEDAGHFVNGAFMRLWRFGAPHLRAGRITTLGQCLQYLKMCAWSELQQHARKHNASCVREVELVEPDDVGEDAPPETRAAVELLAQKMLEVTADDAHAERVQGAVAQLVKIVDDVIEGERERVAVDDSWRFDLAPRVVVATRHPRLFRDAADVSRVLRNVMRRIHRNPQFKYLLSEWSKTDL